MLKTFLFYFLSLSHPFVPNNIKLLSTSEIKRATKSFDRKGDGKGKRRKIKMGKHFVESVSVTKTFVTCSMSLRLVQNAYVLIEEIYLPFHQYVFARRNIPHSTSSQPNQLVGACIIEVCHMIRHVFFLGRRGKGWVADPKGMILWFFGLKIRNVVSSGRNKNIVVYR